MIRQAKALLLAGILALGTGNVWGQQITPGGGSTPVATSSTFGTVKPDNSTITISGGVITAASGGSGCTVAGSAGQLVYNNGSTGCLSSARTITSAGLETQTTATATGTPSKFLTVVPAGTGNTTSFYHFQGDDVNPGDASHTDSMFGWGDNYNGESQVVLGEQAFGWKVEHKYCPSSPSFCQMEFYIQLFGSDASNFRPIFGTYPSTNNQLALNLSATSINFANQAGTGLLSLALSGASSGIPWTITNNVVANTLAASSTGSVLIDATDTATGFERLRVSYDGDTKFKSNVQITQVGAGNGAGLTLVGAGGTNPLTRISVDGSTPATNLYSSSDALVVSNLSSEVRSTYIAADNSTAGNSPSFYYVRTRGTLASPTIVQSGDTLNKISALGYDGAARDFATQITSEVDGTPGANDMPGRLVFRTTPDGSTTLTEALRIDNAQKVILTAITSDATRTDATVCEDTTTHALYSGSGTLGICLGTSSARFKHDIAPLTYGLDAIMALKPISYKLNTDHGDPAKTLLGFTAEQVQPVIPELVGLDPAGKPNTADYVGLIPVLVRAVQQQQAEIEALKAQVANDNATMAAYRGQLVLREDDGFSIPVPFRNWGGR